MGSMIQSDLQKEDWDQKTFTWENKPFYRVKYASVLGIPISRVISVKQAVDKIGQDLPGRPLVLSASDSLFSGELLIELNSAENLPAKFLSGTFFSMFFEGSPKISEWSGILRQVCRANGQEPVEIIPYYANSAQTVLLARLS